MPHEQAIPRQPAPLGVDAAFKTLGAVRKGMHATISEMTEMSFDQLRHGSAALDQLTGAKSVDRIVEIETGLIKSAYETMTQHAARLRDIYFDLGREIAQPLEQALRPADRTEVGKAAPDQV